MGKTTKICNATNTPSFAAFPCTSIPETKSVAFTAVMIQFANDDTTSTHASRFLPVSPYESIGIVQPTVPSRNVPMSAFKCDASAACPSTWIFPLIAAAA